jgi:Flp pilus assembly protein TadB
MKKSQNELRESILSKLMAKIASGKRVPKAVKSMVDKDPELKKKFDAIEKDLEKLGKESDRVSKQITKRYKGTPLEKFFSIG